MGDRGERFCYAGKGSPRGELAPVRATERGLQFLRLIVITPLRLDKLGTRPRAPSLALRAIHLVSPRRGFFTCTSQQILDTNHKKIYNKKLSVSQISVRNATCDIELASDSLTNKLDAVH